MSNATASASAGTILTLIDEVRPKTMWLLEGASEHELLWAPAGTQNHILWHAGPVHQSCERTRFEFSSPSDFVLPSNLGFRISSFLTLNSRRKRRG